MSRRLAVAIRYLAPPQRKEEARKQVQRIEQALAVEQQATAATAGHAPVSLEEAAAAKADALGRLTSLVGEDVLKRVLASLI